MSVSLIRWHRIPPGIGIELDSPAQKRDPAEGLGPQVPYISNIEGLTSPAASYMGATQTGYPSDQQSRFIGLCRFLVTDTEDSR